MGVDNSYSAKVLAELCVAKAFSGGRLGVFVENVPAIDLQAFVSAVNAAAPSKVRIALLGTKTKIGRTPKNIEVTTNPAVANSWRNDKAAREGCPGIFVVLGPTPKVNSLRTVVPVLTARDIRQALLQRCQILLNTPERVAFYKAVGERTGDIATSTLFKFASLLEAAAAKGKATLMEVEPREVKVLGLIPSTSLFNAQGSSSARRVVRKNLDLVRSLRNLQPKLRDSLSSLIETRHALAARATAILNFENTGDFSDLGNLTLEEIEETLRAKSSNERIDRPSPQPTVKRERLDGDALALDLVMNADGRGLGVAAKRFREAIEPDPEGLIDAEELTVGRRTILPRVKVGTTQATGLFGQILTKDAWGGLITTPEAVDFVSAQRLVASGDAVIEEFNPAEEHHVWGTLKRAVDRGLAPATVLHRWEAYAEARNKVLARASDLIDHPLLALAGDKELAEQAETLITSYAGALSAIYETAQELEARGADEASRRLIACALTLDVAFIQAGGEFTAIAAPTHPFHLWRWTGFLATLNQHKAELQEIGQDVLEPLVTDPPNVCPQIVLSPFALKTTALDRPRSFITTGSFATLPLFGEPTARQLGKFRARSLAKVAERLIRLMPHAAFGLRVALIDPPSVSGALEDLLDLVDPFSEDEAIPVHAYVIRTRALHNSTDEEDDAINTLARELIDQAGSLSVAPAMRSLKDVADYLRNNSAHLAVVFDPGVGERIAVGLVQPPALSPLVVPRAYRYDAFDDRLDVVLAGDAEPFSTYHNMFCKTLGIPKTDFIGRRSGASQNVRQLESIARACVWTIVVDQAIEPTLRIGGAERLDWRTDGGRDVVTFTAHPETIEDLIGDAVRAAGLVADEDTRKSILSQLFLLNGEAVLALAKTRPDVSLADPRTAKAMIGVLAANRWYSEVYPDSLVISLDDPTSRQWILGVGTDDRRGDLLGVRQTENGLIVEALEVKAHDAEDAGVKKRGVIVEGKAVIQIDQTIQILRAIFDDASNSPVLRARRDILRDQLYRAVASRPYGGDKRGRYVRLLEELFSKGPASIDGIVFRVQIVAGSSSQSPGIPAWSKSSAGNRIGVVDIIEGRAQGGSQSSGLNSGRTSTPVNNLSHDKKEQATSAPKQGAKSAKDVPPNGSDAKDSKSQPPTPVTPNMKVLIGESAAGYDVFWEPNKPGLPLNNFGLLVTGDPGSGKTQILRTLISEAADQGLPVTIFDFKNDYSDDAFARKHKLNVYDIDREGLPFNPLTLIPDDRGEAQPIRQVHELVSILTRIFSLGSQQESRLRKAITSRYEAHGIRPEVRHKVSSVASVPSFNEVKSFLEEDGKNEPLLNRLSPLFDLNLFPDVSSASTTFEQMIQDCVVLDMHRLPDDRIKAAISEFIIVRLHGYVLKGEQPRELRRLLVFDEAWRVRESIRLQELAREGRAFGVGIAIGTQFPGDIPESLSGNLATQLLLANQDPEHRKAVSRMLCGSAAGPEARRLTEQFAHLKKHEGFFRNQQYAPYCLLMTLPYYKR